MKCIPLFASDLTNVNANDEREDSLITTEKGAQ